MTERELSNHLRELTLAAPPESWREEILAEASKITPIVKQSDGTSRRLKPWLPRAAMILVWLGLALSHYLGEQEDTRLATYLAPTSIPCPNPLTGEEIEWLMAQLFPPEEETYPYEDIPVFSDPI